MKKTIIRLAVAAAAVAAPVALTAGSAFAADTVTTTSAGTTSRQRSLRIRRARERTSASPAEKEEPEVKTSTKRAACQAPGAPSVFPDDWGVGRQGRAKRAQALAMCRTCALPRECGLQALRDFDNGLDVYGIRCGIVFADITRQNRQIARLRTLVGQPRLRATT